MVPVSPNSLSMDVSTVMIAITLRNFLMSAVLPVGNVTCDAAAKTYAMKVTLHRHVNLYSGFTSL